MSNYSEMHKRVIELENQKQSLLRRVDFLETERATFSKIICDLYATYAMSSLPAMRVETERILASPEALSLYHNFVGDLADKPLELKPFIHGNELCFEEDHYHIKDIYTGDTLCGKPITFSGKGLVNATCPKCREIYLDNQKETSTVKTICSVDIESTGYLLHADDGTSYPIRELTTFQEFIDDTDYTRIALSSWGCKVELTTPIKLDIVQSNGFTRIVKVSE